MLRSRTGDVVFLFDVDNTLLDNDRFSAALDARLTQVLGAEGRKRYRQSYETLRDERGYADYLEALGNPTHPEHDSMRRWGPEAFDPNVVDPVLEMETPVALYAPGTWGPSSADSVVVEGDGWHDPIPEASARC